MNTQTLDKQTPEPQTPAHPTRLVLFSFAEHLPLFTPLLAQLQAREGRITQRRFPDGETYLRVDSPVAGCDCVILANLVAPDEKFLPLCFLATTLKELGARSVGLIAPYLCYMRQDIRFNPGEAISSQVFARLVSDQVNWLVTVDPHLHRYHSLDDVYSIPSVAVQGTQVLARFLASSITEASDSLLLVGPDAESEQWVKVIAEHTGQPYVVGRKERHGDRDVRVSLPPLAAYRGRRAVIVDDVISSGNTLLETLAALRTAGMESIDCAAIHGIFADGSDEKLLANGVQRLITSNSIPHCSNQVDLSQVLASAVFQLLKRDQ